MLNNGFICGFCGCYYTNETPCRCRQTPEIDIDVGEFSLSDRIKQFIPKRRKMDENIDQDRFELFYVRVRETFELMYRFAFFAVVAFFAVNLVLLLMCLTFIFLLLTINHVIVPLARTAGLY